MKTYDFFAKRMEGRAKETVLAAAMVKLFENDLEEQGGLLTGSITFNFCFTEDGGELELEESNLHTKSPAVYAMLCDSIIEMLQGHLANYRESVDEWLNSIIEEAKEDD